MSEDPKLPVTATVTPAPIPESFDLRGVVSLARDLAIGMYATDVLLKKNDITPEQYETLKKIPYFQKIVEQQALEWNAPKNVQQRLALQTAVGLEVVMPDVISRAAGKNEPLAGIAQLVKVLADIAGVSGNVKQPQGPTEKFKITINLGADTEVYEKTKPVFQIENGEDAIGDDTIAAVRGSISSLLTIQTEPETKGSAETIQTEPEGEGD